MASQAPRFLLLLAIAALASPAAADVLVPKRGKKVQGAIVEQTASEVVFNVYWSRNPGVTNTDHIVRLPMSGVKKVEAEPHPRVEVFRRLAKVARTDPEDASDVEAYLEVAAFATKHKLKRHAAMCAALAMHADPGHAGALAAIGGKSKWAAAKKGNPLIDDALRSLLEQYIGEDDPEARAGMAPAFKKQGFKAKPFELERYRRSALQPTGYQQDRPISYRSDQQPGAVYTLYVPDTYTPWKPWPLVIGLHGGGPDGKAGDEVVGSGPSAMNFYRSQATRRGFIVACPNARSAGWGSKDNETLVRDVITELKLLYHIDVDRIYLTGHSMGGFGTWILGPRLAADLAGVSPMAGAGGTVAPLVDTNTPIFIYHSDNDFIDVSSDRQKAKQLRDSGLDFVYTELPGQGHGFPASVQSELFDFFTPRRRYDRKRKNTWPRSSFLGKPTKEEKRYLGDPEAEISGDAPDLATWVGQLRLGGGGALGAVAQLAEQKPEGAAAKIAKLVADGKLPFDARAYAARALGLLGDASGRAALEKAVAVPAEKKQSMVAVEAAGALARLGSSEACGALGRGVQTWAGYFDSKRMAGGMRFSDWTRAVGTLAAIVEAWATVATTESSPGALSRHAVSGVLAQDVDVQTSERVPQDPSTARTALARAVGRAYKAAGATEADWDALLEALTSDAKAQAAAEAAR